MPSPKKKLLSVGRRSALAIGSPHLEGFEAKGVDVLILSDPVDDFDLAF